MTETIKISQLPNAGVLSGTERVAIVQGGVTKVSTTRQIADLFSGTGSGSVTSVGLSMPTDVFDVADTPISTSGTFGVTFKDQAAGVVFAGPASGSSAAPTFRALVNGDMPIVSIAKGGTGQSTKTLGFDALAPTTTQGDIIFFDGVNNVRLGASTAGYLLQTNGVGSSPTWAGFLQAGTSAVTRSWQDKNRDIVSVKDFGAVGDGTTDDTAAFQAAINYAKERKRRIYCPSGTGGATYLVGTLTINGAAANDRHSVEIVGECWEGDIGQTNDGGVIIKLKASTDGNLFTVGTNAAPCRFENLLLDGSRDSQTQGASVVSWAVDFTSHTADQIKKRSGHFYNCYIISFLSGGVRIGTVRNAGTMDRVTILNVGERITGTAAGVSSTTITLASSASAVDSFYVGKDVIITGSTGATEAVQQLRTITAYVGATRVATVDSAWNTLPAGTVTYRVNIGNADCVQIGSCNDWRIDRCDFGGATRNGVYGTGGASVDFCGTNTFTNDNVGVRWDGAAGDMVWIGGSIDTNKRDGAVFIGSSTTTGTVYSRQLLGVRFNQNGIGADDTYADVVTSSDFGVSIIGPKPFPGTLSATGGRRVKYFLENSGGHVDLVAPRYDAPGASVLATGTAQAGSGTTITLAAGASSTNDRYNNAAISITGGTGAGQVNAIADYDGSTKVATVHTTWSTPPDATSTYSVYARPPYTTALVLDPTSVTQMQRQRTITGTSNEISVANGDGVSGNPTLSLPTALTFTGKTVTGGTFSSATAIGVGAAAAAGSAAIIATGTTVPSIIGTRTISGALSSLSGAAQIGLDGGVISAGAGPRLLFFCDDASGNKEFMGAVGTAWATAVDGGESADMIFNVRTNAADTNATTEAMRLTATKNVLINTAAVTTTATDGFLYVSSCAGAPTGTPTSYTGRIPIVVDSTNNKLYFYSGGAWRDAGP